MSQEEEKDFEFEDIIDDDDKELLASTENVEVIEDDDNYDEVLQLTEYVDGSSNNNSPAIIAEYNNINIVQVEKKHKLFATSFVQKITKFIIDFKDVELTEKHSQYLKQVGQLQIENLQDLMSLVEINKSMMHNIVLRVNSVQAEDYSMIATYTNLMNTHLKLLKELSTAYKNIPSILKKMKTEVFCNQDLLPGAEDGSNDIITENYGTTQFNNQKEMLKKLKENYEK